MGNEDDSDSIDPREVYGWEVTEKELENHFSLIRIACHSIYDAGVASNHSIERVEEQLNLLQQEIKTPFPLPQKGFAIGQAELIFNAEYWVVRVRRRLCSEAKKAKQLGKLNLYTYIKGLYKRLFQTIAGFRGGKKVPSCGSDPGMNKKTATNSLSEDGKELSDQEFNKNLQLVYEASLWTYIATIHADGYPKTIYEKSLCVAKECLKRLKNESQPPYSFLPRRHTLEQAKMRLGAEDFAKKAYESFHYAFDKDLLQGDDGVSRKRSIHQLYREFNPEFGDEPQPNIKSFLGDEFFHYKRPDETLMENQDFWETLEGKICKEQAPWLKE